LPVLSRVVGCEAPYSFYFNLIEPFWKSITSDSSPLHRLTTLARKQGARALLIEDASNIECIAQEIATLDARLGGGGTAEAMLLSFLAEIPEMEDINTVSDNCLIGQCTLINYRPRDAVDFQASFIYEAFFATPSLDTGERLLNNFINCEAVFEVTVHGRPFRIKGLYYAQQNGITSVCAHACIRMAARTLHPDRPSPTTEEINCLVGDPPPVDGMLVEQIADALGVLADREVALVDCASIEPSEYVSVLAAAADSGDIALLVFETVPHSREGDGDGETEGATPTNHVVVVYGYTRNTDEWHPQAIPEYTGEPSARHCPSSAWVDHFIIHDDNFGPYLALSSRALEADPTLRAEAILIIRRLTTNLEAHAAEAATALVMNQARQIFADDAHDNKWLNYLLRYHKPLVTRPVLLSRDEYCAHIAELRGHDGSGLVNGSVTLLSGTLPDVMWMVEFTLPDLFTGNHSKLGEILFEANHPGQPSFSADRVRGLRLPSRFMLARGGEARDLGEFLQPENGELQDVHNFPLTSHSPLYERNPPERQW
jgi:hypothetical protein